MRPRTGRVPPASSEEFATPIGVDIHQLREDRFAIEAAEALAETVAGHEADIIVVAPPATLHVLRDHYTPAIRKRLIAEVDKDLVKHPAAEIVQILTKWPRRS
jgi:protein required for attachment to host cells